ncbi:hypothetical protein ONZ45_g4856 [Pleurotus djamor]|nr:hypothetical protein ONZ45_g4856 [Pleurotus djamor]
MGNLSDRATRKLNEVVLASWSDQTKSNYGAGILRFNQFCEKERIPEQDRMPASPTLLAAFAADAAGSVSRSAILSWFSGLKAWHTMNGATWYGDDLFVSQAKQGASKMAPSLSRRPTRPPVTLEHIISLSHSLDQSSSFDSAVWVVALCAFWGCCRLGELTVKSSNSFNPTYHVSRSTSVSYHQSIPSSSSNSTIPSLHLSIPWTKTTKESGALLLITGRPSLCPCDAMRNHLSVNVGIPPDSHLFSYRSPSGSWCAMSKTAFLERCTSVWSSHGLTSDVKGHSFRIGGATELLLSGVPPEVVASVGRWKSSAFLLYWRRIEEILPHSISRTYDPDRIKLVAAAFEKFRISQSVPCTVTL